MSYSLRMALSAQLGHNLYLKSIWMLQIDKSLMVPLGVNNPISSISESAMGTGDLDTQAREKALQSPGLINLSFATSVDAPRILLKSAQCPSIWLCCTSNLRDAKHLKGKGLKPTSTFIRIAQKELVVRTMFLMDRATPWFLICLRILLKWRTRWLSTPQTTCLATSTSPSIS